MDQTDTRFDWISWLASVPGIPADWPVCPVANCAAPGGLTVQPARPRQADMAEPQRIAA